jgi:hypothetical protein
MEERRRAEQSVVRQVCGGLLRGVGVAWLFEHVQRDKGKLAAASRLRLGATATAAAKPQPPNGALRLRIILQADTITASSR